MIPRDDLELFLGEQPHPLGVWACRCRQMEVVHRLVGEVRPALGVRASQCRRMGVVVHRRRQEVPPAC